MRGENRSAIIETSVDETNSKKPNNKLKKVLKFALKVVISGVALYFVYRKVDSKQVVQQLQDANILYFILAILSFNVSKWISTLRIWSFLKSLGIQIGHWFNIKLYYIGAFYNLFLPGSVGGDGYKVYLLKKRYDLPTKKFVSVALLDRGSGLAALLFLTGIMIIFTDFPSIPYSEWSGVTIAVLIYPAYYLVLRFMFRTFAKQFHATNLASIASQLLQFATAFFILKALGVEENYWNYLVLFMLASLSAVVPVTPGGLGAREFVIAYSYTYMNVDKQTGVLMATLVFAVMAISSFVGLFFNFSKMDGVAETNIDTT